MSWTQGQIKVLATAVGMPNADIMAAIAMAESRGNPNAHNPVAPDDSYGLWQINMYGSLGPSRRKAYGISTNDALLNPLTNALAAKKVLSGQGLSAWSTYTSGAYRQYLSGTNTPSAADKATPPPGVTQASWGGDLWNTLTTPHWMGTPIIPNDQPGGQDNVLGNPLASLGTINDAIVKGSAWLSNPKNWVRIGYFAGGAALSVGGLLLIVRATPAGQAATKATASAAKIGALL